MLAYVWRGTRDAETIRIHHRNIAGYQVRRASMNPFTRQYPSSLLHGWNRYDGEKVEDVW
jgi:hypothetical protein